MPSNIKHNSFGLSQVLYLSKHFLLFVVIFVTVFSTLFLNISSTSKAKDPVTFENNFLGSYSPLNNEQISLSKPEKEDYDLANKRLEVEEARIAAELERKRIEEEKISKTLNFLISRGSPVANYEIAQIIVQESEEHNADYRVVIAIMTIESGACSKSFWYNCFGYLNGARYGSYEEAFLDLVPKVSSQYAAVYGWDFESLAQAYGQHNWQHHSGNMRSVASSI